MFCIHFKVFDFIMVSECLHVHTFLVRFPVLQGTLVCIQGRGERETVHKFQNFCLVKAWQSLFTLSSNWESFLNMVSCHFNQSEKSHDQKYVFF